MEYVSTTALSDARSYREDCNAFTGNAKVMSCHVCNAP